MRGNITPQLGNSQRALPPGFSVQIVPLRYIGTREMMRVLEPLAKDAAAIRPDDLRNLLILSGTERELRHLLETIDMFDVDWIAGMSVGLFVLRNADVKAVSQELDKIVGDRNIEPAHRHPAHRADRADEALLVITPQPAYLEEAKKWISRLDQGGGGDGPRFYVYHLQNQRAEKLGPLLTQAFTGRAAPATPAAAPTVAPGTPAGTIVSPPTFQPQHRNAAHADHPGEHAPAAARSGGAGIARAAEGIGVVRNIQVVADKDNNTLLIVATAPEYTVIEAALKKLDMPARQVMMEVTVANVTLTDELDFGVDWLFKGGAPSGRGSGGLILGPDSTAGNPGLPSGTGTTTRARHRAGIHLHHQQRELSRGHPGGPAPARHLRRHEGHRQPAPCGARQPEGDHQGGRQDPALPADLRRHGGRHRGQRGGLDDLAVHRHRCPAADHAAHQCRRAGHAGRAGRSEHTRATCPPTAPGSRRRSTRDRCSRS